MKTKYIGVDWDKTLAVHATGEGLNPADILNQPLIQPMVNRVKKWLALGQEVRIVSARAGKHLHIPDYDIDLAVKNIQDNLEKNGLPRLVVQNHKCNLMDQLWDDRAMPVEINTGESLGGKLELLSIDELYDLKIRIERTLEARESEYLLGERRMN